MYKYRLGDKVEICYYGQNGHPDTKWTKGTVVGHSHLDPIHYPHSELIHVQPEGKDYQNRKYPCNVRLIWKPTIHGNELRMPAY